MAQFRGTIQSGRGKASRLGTKKDGISADVNGWESGVRVEGRNDDDGDVFDIFMTNGSEDCSESLFIGRVVIHDGRPTFIGGDSLELDGVETDSWIGAELKA